MLERHVYGVLAEVRSSGNRWRNKLRRLRSETSIIGGYSYRNDRILRPHYIGRLAKWEGDVPDWDTMFADLAFKTEFRRGIRTSEPMEAPAELDSELRQLFGKAGASLDDDPDLGLSYRLMLFAPTLCGGVVGRDLTEGVAFSAAYAPAFSAKLHPIDGMFGIEDASSLGEFGRLVAEHTEALADRFPGNKQCRLDGLNHFDRVDALQGLGVLAEPLVTQLGIPEPIASNPPPQRVRRLPERLRRSNPNGRIGRGR